MNDPRRRKPPISKPLLSRYLDPGLLSVIGRRPLAPRRLVIGNLAGAHQSPLSGLAVEFAGRREYVPGDDPRRIDWRVYFTRDRYVVKQHELETNFVCHLLLDVSASMRYGEGCEQKLLYAAQLAAMLAFLVIRQGDKASLTAFDDRLRGFVPPSSSMDQIERITQHLADVEAVHKTDMAACLDAAAATMGRRELVLIFSDFFSELAPLEEALHRLRLQRHEVVLFQVLARNELTFDFEGPVRFVGLESAEEVLTRADDVREEYLSALRRLQNGLDEMARRNDCEYAAVDTSRSEFETLLDYLNQRCGHAARGRIR
jgi:uncharacterized protein (DUF58 family)